MFWFGHTEWQLERNQLICHCFRFRLLITHLAKDSCDSDDIGNFLTMGRELVETDTEFSCFGPAGSPLFDNLQVPGYCSNIKLPWSAETELCRF